MQTYLKDTTTKKYIRIDALYTLGHSSIAEKKIHIHQMYHEI